jgi:RimJ/RimL family protein N-acetyltransferase
MSEVYIRPLEIKDAYSSVNWRNNKAVWELTGGKPDRQVTIEMELEWIQKAVVGVTEKRFAICLHENDKYIGNVQLTHLTATDAQFHIFIGETAYWNKGLGKKATLELINHAFTKLGLQEIYLWVNNKHTAAIKSYLNSGFTITDFKQDTQQVKMTICKA